MEAVGVIIFLPREGSGPSLMLEDILFDPAAAWLAALVPIVPYYFYRMRKYRPRPVQR